MDRILCVILGFTRILTVIWSNLYNRPIGSVLQVSAMHRLHCSKFFFLFFFCLCSVFSLPCVTLLGQFIEQYFYGIFFFNLALNVVENIFKTSLKNAQNKHHWHVSVVWNNLLLFICVSLGINEILSIKRLAFTVLRTVLKSSVNNSETNPKLLL